jgi:hypothetical protein
MVRLRRSAAAAIIAFVLLVGLALAAGCGDSGGAMVVAPEKIQGPLALRLEIDVDGGATLRWEDQDSESGYRIAGSVRYGPSCEVVEEGVTEIYERSLNTELAADATELAFPRPADERLSVLLEVVAKLTAEGIVGSKSLTDGIAFTADPICE